MMEIIVSLIAGAPAPFISTDTLENTLLILGIFVVLLAVHKLMMVPAVCMLGGFLMGAIAFGTTNVFFFPFFNLFIILMSVYVVYSGYAGMNGH